MTLARGILCILCPPLAVLDRGCGAILLTFFLSLIAWIPGVIAAILFSAQPRQAADGHPPREIYGGGCLLLILAGVVVVPLVVVNVFGTFSESAKRVAAARALPSPAEVYVNPAEPRNDIQAPPAVEVATPDPPMPSPSLTPKTAGPGEAILRRRAVLDDATGIRAIPAGAVVRVVSTNGRTAVVRRGTTQLSVPVSDLAGN